LFISNNPDFHSELFQGRKYTGPEVDVWSLGVILYVLCTGCLPFDGNSLKEIREVVCRGKYKIPYYLSEKCELLLRKFLVRDPSKRASLDILVDDQWINEGYNDSPIIPEPRDPISEPDEDVIRYMTEKFSIPRDQILNCLKEGIYDDVTAIYFLTVDQKANGKLQLNALQSPVTQQLQPPQSGNRRVSNQTAAMMAIGEEGNGNEEEAGRPHSSYVPAEESSGAHTEVRTRSRTSGSVVQPRPVSWVGSQSPPAAAPSQQQQATVEHAHEQQFQAPVQAHHSRRNTQPILPSASMAAAVQNVQQQQQQQQQQQATLQPQPKTGFMTSFRAFTRRISESHAAGSPQAMAMQAAAAAASAASQAPQPASNGEDKPRALRFTFNSTTTSTKPPEEIMKSLIQTCNAAYIKFTLHNRFLIECSWHFHEHSLPKHEKQPSQHSNQPKPVDSMDVEHLQRALAEVMRDSNGNVNNNFSSGDLVRFEIEVCELPRLKNMHGLRFRRICGPAEEYRSACEHILRNVRL
jgi:MAP/microtubule affinity-regulating kinase